MSAPVILGKEKPAGAGWEDVGVCRDSPRLMSCEGRAMNVNVFVGGVDGAVPNKKPTGLGWVWQAQLLAGWIACDEHQAPLIARISSVRVEAPLSYQLK